MNRKRMILTVLAVLLISLCLAACGGQGSGETTEALSISDVPIQHEEDLGGIYIQKSIDEFGELGFDYGDSIDVVFSNGYTLEDLPYYNGYYVEVGAPLLVGYPGSEHIKAGINSGPDLWEEAGLTEDCTATLTLREKGKYAEIQSSLDLHYSDERSDYDSDEAFANYRRVKAGKLKEGVLCRAASPVDNYHGRAATVDRLIAEAGVKDILDLSDEEEDVEEFMAEPDYDSPYAKGLYEQGRMTLLDLNMDYRSEEFRSKVARGLMAISEGEGPFLVHCLEGKDRTGFVCMLLEALAGASLDEITGDFMKTYENYYGVTKEGDPDRYQAVLDIYFQPMIETIAGGDPAGLSTSELSACAETFLQEAGMTEDQIRMLKKRMI